jgi:hypothetical protein
VHKKSASLANPITKVSLSTKETTADHRLLPPTNINNNSVAALAAALAVLKTEEASLRKHKVADLF